MIIVTSNGNYGPFDSIESGEDRLICVRAGTATVEFQFNVIGDYSLSEDDSLAPQFTPVRKKAEIQAEIDRIEQETLENRGARELHIAIIEANAPSVAASKGVTVEEYLAAQPYYQKLKAVDAQIHALRVELVGAPE